MSKILDSLPKAGVLDEVKAIELWLAKWRGEAVSYLTARFAIDESTVKKVWRGELFPGSELRANQTIWQNDPELARHLKLARPKFQQDRASSSRLV